MPKSVRGVMREFKDRQLHSGSRAGKVVTSRKQAVAIALSEQRQTRKLHPALKARAAAVTQAHAHLSRTVPGFKNLPGREQLRHTQRHVTRRMARSKNGY